MRACGAALLLALPLPAAAQNAAMVTVMQTINDAEPTPAKALIIAELLSRSQAAARAEKRCVPDRIEVAALAPATASQDAFRAITTGKLKNAWTTWASAPGCAGSRPEHFLVLRLPDDKLRIIGVNAGTTLTSYAQMRIAAGPVSDAALAAAQKADPACTKAGMDILYTTLGKQHPDLGPDFYGVRMTGIWDEVWTLSACGGQAAVPITFTADGKGGAAVKISSAVVFRKP